MPKVKKDIESLGITNVDFAEKVGIHFSMVSKLRHGHRAPSLETLISIKNAYELPADELLRAAEGGAESFGAYLRERVFKDELQLAS